MTEAREQSSARRQRSDAEFAGGAIDGLSIVICTRNRPADLQRCVESVVASIRARRPTCTVAILVLDDGESREDDVLGLQRLAASVGLRLTHRDKRDNAGLWNSRWMAVDTVQTSHLLFLDDDVELLGDYVARLVDDYVADATLAGVGGVDTIRRLPSRPQVWFERVVGLRATDPGRRSLSGCNVTMDEWKRQTEPFQSEFLSGCNMSFRVAALSAGPRDGWFAGYSAGEDGVLSRIAAITGPLLVDPRLEVRHHQVPTSRDAARRVAFSTVWNHTNALDAENADVSRRLWWCISALGMLAERVALWLCARGGERRRLQADGMKGHLHAFLKTVGHEVAHIFDLRRHRDNR